MSLSALGLGMAFATIYSIPPNIEPICWVAIFLISTYFIASMAPGNYFLHGLIVCVIDCAFATVTEVLLSATYLSRHQLQVDMYAKIYDQTGLSSQQIILISRPALGVLIGILVGTLATFSSKYFAEGAVEAPAKNIPEEEGDQYTPSYQPSENYQNTYSSYDTNVEPVSNAKPSLVYSLIVLVNPSEKQLEWVNEGRDNENAIVIPNVMNTPIKGLTFSGMHFDLVD